MAGIQRLELSLGCIVESDTGGLVSYRDHAAAVESRDSRMAGMSGSIGRLKSTINSLKAMVDHFKNDMNVAVLKSETLQAQLTEALEWVKIVANGECHHGGGISHCSGSPVLGFKHPEDWCPPCKASAFLDRLGVKKDRGYYR